MTSRRRPAVPRPARPSASRRRWRPFLEALEDRTVPATMTVNTLSEANVRDNFLSLREALLVNTGALAPAALTPAEQAQVNGPLGNDTVQFSVTGTVTLTSALPDLLRPVTIAGPGAPQFTLQRSPA